MLSMFVLAAVVAASPPPPSGAQVLSAENAAPPACGSKGVAPVNDNRAVGAQKLNELPNANHYLSVFRVGPDGCPKPAIVRYDIGSNPQQR